MKGIVLAGGSGTRLYPVTKAVNKHLLPIYDKPMIYYPLSLLMLAGIREILIISSPNDIAGFQQLLGNGSELGLAFSYAVQPKPNGIAQAFLVGRDFIGSSPVCLILGDNIFYGEGMTRIVRQASSLTEGAKVFAYWVDDPERYCVIEWDEHQQPINLQEKPAVAHSNYVVPGMYFYDSQVTAIAQELYPSARGELEITELNLIYLRAGLLKVEKLGRGIAWLDTGTHKSWLQASSFIETIQQRQGLQIGCLEEIAFNLNYITANDLKRLASAYKTNGYGRYLLNLLEERESSTRAHCISH